MGLATSATTHNASLVRQVMTDYWVAENAPGRQSSEMSHWQRVDKSSYGSWGLVLAWLGYVLLGMIGCEAFNSLQRQRLEEKKDYLWMWLNSEVKRVCESSKIVDEEERGGLTSIVSRDAGRWMKKSLVWCLAEYCRECLAWRCSSVPWYSYCICDHVSLSHAQHVEKVKITNRYYSNTFYIHCIKQA